MWPRIVEIALGLWLMVSPAVVGQGAGGRWVPWIVGAVIVALAGSTFVSRRFRLLNVAQLPVAAFLIVWGWSQTPRPGPASAQSLLLTGLVLALMAVVPTEATRLPEGWRRYARERD